MYTKLGVDISDKHELIRDTVGTVIERIECIELVLYQNIIIQI